MGNESHYLNVERRLLERFIAEFRTSNTRLLRSDDAMVDVLGMCLYASPFWGDYIHIGVGFEVAYLSEKASSKARNTR